MRQAIYRAAIALPLITSACAIDDGGPTPYDDDEATLSDDNVNDGAPDNDGLPDDNKADAVYPAKFEVKFQSPVKSQGRRGVCSIFAATALVENLYIKAGMPVEQADFSEQYMQWGVKNLIGDFARTEGSSADSNLRFVVQYGTVKEGEWAYEADKWTTANDPACTSGENLPTKCYTNGEPPANVAAAQKFKLPQTRWINTNSIKAHITAKGTGVNVGMTFYYQAWNHRGSTIPVNAEYWRKGYVTYPNAKDKEESLKHRAGHAIEIVGWDDDLEVESRDGEGNPIIVNGVAKKEKGFWIFKNSWGTAGFGIEHPSGPGYGYLSYQYVKEFGSAVTAELPQLGGGGGGGGGTGGTPHSYTASPASAIPDNAPAGTTSTITVNDTGTLKTVKVTTDITHSYRGDLLVTLSHGGVTKTLSDRAGGSADDLKTTFTVTGFENAALGGAWVLKVVDTAAQDVGTFNSWKLDVTTN